MPPTTAVEIRPATTEDAAAIEDVATRTWAHDYPKMLNRENVEDAAREWYDQAQTEETIRDPSNLVYLAEDDDIRGFVHAFDDDDTGVILRVYVAPETRGEGVGRGLVAAASEALADRGCTRVTATVLAANEAGAGFYEALGFELTDEVGRTVIGGERYEERTYERPQA